LSIAQRPVFRSVVAAMLDSFTNIEGKTNTASPPIAH
jgi:hypothetical protein